MRFGFIFPVTWALCAATAGFAQTAPEPDADYQQTCEVRGHNGMVTLVLCPAVLSAEAFRQEGILACDGRLPCGAWFWTDPAVVPAEAPARHDELDPVAIQASVGIWMNELNQYISVDKE